MSAAFDTEAATNGSLHLIEPVFLTSELCEALWSSPHQLSELGLEYRYRGDGRIVDRDGRPLPWDDGFPLTNDQREYIREGSVTARNRDWLLGYSCLYQGHKYLSPVTELRYNNRSGAVAALDVGHRIADRIAPALEEIGGLSWVDPAEFTGQPDHHSVLALIPMGYAYDYEPGENWEIRIQELLG